MRFKVTAWVDSDVDADESTDKIQDALYECGFEEVQIDTIEWKDAKGRVKGILYIPI